MWNSIAATFGMLLAISFGSLMVKGQDKPVPTIPTTLTADVRESLTVARKQLLSQIDAFNAEAATFNTECGEVPASDTARNAVCDRRLATLNTKSDAMDKAKEQFAAQLNAAVKTADADPGAGKRLEAADTQVIKREIAGVQNALRQLNKSIDLDAAQGEEWRQTSEGATHEAWILAGSATLDLLGAHADHKVKDADSELEHSLDLLSGTTDPNRREQLHAAYSVLKERKGELEQMRSLIDSAHQGFDIGVGLKDSEPHDSKMENLLELVWMAGERLEVIPPQASVLKTYVELSYLTAEQAVSSERIDALNSNSEQYLASLKVLKSRMEALVKAQKDQE
jgi:hypothetical protein